MGMATFNEKPADSGFIDSNLFVAWQGVRCTPIRLTINADTINADTINADTINADTIMKQLEISCQLPAAGEPKAIADSREVTAKLLELVNRDPFLAAEFQRWTNIKLLVEALP